MKLLKSAVLIFLSALFVANFANAEPEKKNEQQNPQKSTQQNSKKNQQVKKKQAEDKNLKQFNTNVAIRLVSAQVINQNQKQIFELIYSVENKANKRDIKSVNWVGAFLYNNEVFFAQDIPIIFEQPLKRKTKNNVTVTIPFELIPAQAQAILLNPQTQIKNLVGAKNITFTNGTKIEVK